MDGQRAAVLARAEATYNVELREKNEPMKRAEMRASLALYDGVLMTLGDRYDAGVFEAAGTPRAKILANFGVGFNHIDVAAAEAAGLVVTNTPGAVTDATADVAMTLLLMTCRRAGEGERLVRSGAWEGWHPVQMLGLHVTGKRVGILGMGRIGKLAAINLQSLGFDVAGLSRSGGDGAVPMFSGDEMDRFLARTDLLICLLPLTPDTRGILNAETFAKLPRGAALVHAGRGAHVSRDRYFAAAAGRERGRAAADARGAHRGSAAGGAASRAAGARQT